MPAPAYYTGPGVLHHAGKDYKFGAELPDSVNIEALIKKGKASTTKPAVRGAAQATDETAALRAKVKELTETVRATERGAKGWTEEMDRLRGQLQEAVDTGNAAATEAATLREQLAQANATISELTAAQLSPPAAPAAPAAPAPPVQAAGPKK